MSDEALGSDKAPGIQEGRACPTQWGWASPCKAYFKPGPTPGPERWPSLAGSRLPKRKTIAHDYKHFVW